MSCLGTKSSEDDGQHGPKEGACSGVPRTAVRSVSQAGGSSGEMAEMTWVGGVEGQTFFWEGWELLGFRHSCFKRITVSVSEWIKFLFNPLTKSGRN